MNKYDEKVMKLAAEDSIIYELIQEDINSPSTQILDFLLEQLLAFIKALKDLKKRDSYYLVITDNKSEIVHFQRNLKTSQFDVTNVVQQASEKNSFEFEGHKYKLYRKIK